MNRRPIAVVGGVLANRYQSGGAAWTRLSWILGLKRLGFDVYLVEQINAENCHDESGRPARFEDSANLKYFRAVTSEFGIARSSALFCERDGKSAGLSLKEMDELAAAADLIINITGHLQRASFMETAARKVYLDLDPGYTQLWYQKGWLGPGFHRHDHYFTIGEAIGSAGCPIPTGGIPWQITRQPVLLDHWPACDSGDANRFTTVATWRDDYGTLDFGMTRLGLKVHEFRRFIDFPRRVPQSCEIALKIHDDDGGDREELQKRGWVIRDPAECVAGPLEFRSYVQQSGAEFSVAKGAYVALNSGWFSDRTVRYLASGKPALVQETGCSANYPAGSGLLTFRTMDDAVRGAKDIALNYRDHCRAARQLAESYFDSDRVVGDLLERVGSRP